MPGRRGAAGRCAVVIHEAIDTAGTLLVAVILWAGAIGGSVVFVLAVAVGTVMLQPPWAQRGAWRGSVAPQPLSCGSADTGSLERTSDGRTGLRETRQPQETP